MSKKIRTLKTDFAFEHAKNHTLSPRQEIEAAIAYYKLTGKVVLIDFAGLPPFTVYPDEPIENQVKDLAIIREEVVGSAEPVYDEPLFDPFEPDFGGES